MFWAHKNASDCVIKDIYRLKCLLVAKNVFALIAIEVCGNWSY